jgi:serine/threonine-protein kinase
MATDDALTTCPQCGKKFPNTVRMCPEDGTVLEHTTPTPSHAGQVLDGKYRLDALLAEGGMGAVYRATHVMLGKTVAIKLIRSAIVASPEIVRRFQREARAATALNHPNIVSVYDLGQTPDGTLYIAMEYIDGPSLKTLIQSGRAIPVARTIAILRQVASALATAHRHNIVHRDLKPHNIMLAAGPDGSEVAKLVDFGIAKTFDESTQLTSAGSALGTPYYMSPEQIEGRTVDARCDIYALGIILYEMLVGEVPFADQSTPAVLVKQLKERPIRPSLKNAAVPPALEAIALRCLEKDPEQRYQTADAFAAALNEAAVTLTAPETANDVTLPMARAAVPPVLPGASPAQTDATLLSPAKAAQQVSSASAPPVAAPLPMQAPAAPVAAVPKSAADTKPTVAQPAIAPAVAAPLPPSPQRSSSIAPLIAVAAVLLVLAGGYLAWSGRQSPDTTTATVTNPPTDAPATTPASAQPAAPPVAAADTTAATPTSAPGAPAASPSAPPVPATPPASAANQPAATAAATKESQSAKSTPPASIGSATKAASTAAANASKNVAAPPLPPATAAAAGSAPAPAREAPAQPAPAAAPPTIPENAAVAFHCSGAPEVCASLRTTVNDALDKAGFRLVSNADRADIAVGAVAGVLDEKASRQFGQNFNTRTYQIELSGEAPKFGDTVSMPPTSTVSFDATVGRERLEEKSRLVASDIVDRVRAYVKKKRGA